MSSAENLPNAPSSYVSRRIVLDWPAPVGGRMTSFEVVMLSRDRLPNPEDVPRFQRAQLQQEYLANDANLHLAKGHDAARTGDLISAIAHYRQGIAATPPGKHAVTRALNHKRFAQALYLSGRPEDLVEAETHYEHALVFFKEGAEPGQLEAEIASVREDLARLMEARIMSERVFDLREQAKALNEMVCSNYFCPLRVDVTDIDNRYKYDPVSVQRFKVCGRCELPRYCSAECQAEDWRERHKQYCKLLLEEQKTKNLRPYSTRPAPF